MATPDIKTSISEGYERGIDRIGPWLPALAVLGIISGGVALAIAQLQAQLVPDADDIIAAVFAGDTDVLSKSDLRTINLIGGVHSAFALALNFAAMAVFGGLLHRERHGQAADAPTPASIVGQLIEAAGSLMPKLAILAGLSFVGQAASAILGSVLGGLVGLAAIIVLIYLSVRWVYAPVIAGSGEATGSDAFDRSAETVQGDGWKTFGVLIVIGLATIIPFVIGGVIVAALLPNVLSQLALYFIITAFGMPVAAAAFESAWAQVEGGEQGAPPAQQQPPAAEPQPPVEPTSDDDGSPFV